MTGNDYYSNEIDLSAESDLQMGDPPSLCWLTAGYCDEKL